MQCRSRRGAFLAAMVQAVSDMTYVLFLLPFGWRVVFGKKNHRTFTVYSALKCVFTACFVSFLWPSTRRRSQMRRQRVPRRTCEDGSLTGEGG